MSAPRKLSPLDATLFVTGGIFGVGIFFTPQYVAERAFEPWAYGLLWVFGGLVALCAAFTFAELGASLPRAGGWFVFLRAAYGPFPAFLFAWVVLFVISTGATAAMTDFAATQLSRAIPGLPRPDGLGHRIVAASIIVAVTAVALRGVKQGATLQNACMLIKTVVLLGLVAAGGLLFLDGGDADPAGAAAAREAAQAASGRGSIWRGMTAALLPVFFSYGGWQMVAYIAPAVVRPERTLPRAIVAGVGAVVALYLLANLAFAGSLGLAGVAAGPDFAARIAREALGGAGERILAGGMAVSALGVATVTILGTPWLYVAMARERLFFQALGRVDRRGVPGRALLLQAAIALVYLFKNTLQELVDSVVFVEWIFHGLVAYGLIRLRRKQPELPRPFRSPAFPLMPAAYLAAATLVVGGTLWQAEARLKYGGLAVVALGALLYLPWRRRGASEAGGA